MGCRGVNPSPLTVPPPPQIEENIKRWKGVNPRLSLTLAPHAPYTVSDASFARLRGIAEEHDLKIHLHLHETSGECHDSTSGVATMHKHLSEQRCRPFVVRAGNACPDTSPQKHGRLTWPPPPPFLRQNLDRLGVVCDRLIAVHMTQLDDKEIQRCADAGVSVVHCPVSNMKLASGASPAARFGVWPLTPRLAHPSQGRAVCRTCWTGASTWRSALMAP